MAKSATSPYRMTLSLNVLNHLGLKLYSNVPAVLSEVVANAWDADAQNVQIHLAKTKIVIEDDGEGLSQEQINDRYLRVGYRRREDRGDTTKSGRPVMGRKGIGKLSLFSIAEVVDIYTIHDGNKSAFRMRLADIKKLIESSTGESVYHPEAIAPAGARLTKGTRIELTSLTKRVSGLTETGLRTRLARRFSVIGGTASFDVAVNGTAVGMTDRDYFHKLEYVWWYGKAERQFGELCTRVTADHEETRAAALKVHPGEADEATFEVFGWIGTVHKPKELSDPLDNLNKITILCRGKLAQEDILTEFNDGRVFTKYLIGEIQADFLDVSDDDDIATSNRQRFIEDDPRYVALRAFLRQELNHVGARWEQWRIKAGTEEATKDPVIERWYKSLGKQERKRAEALFGKINQLTTDSDEQRREMLQSGILAFETLRQRDNLDAIELMNAPTLAEIGRLFASHDDLEAVLYHRIVRERLAVIDTLRKKVEKNQLEKVIQEHLYKHLWLLDPSWERATGTEFKEKTVERAFKKAVATLSTAERASRLDIGYQRAAGQHVIIELKRPKRQLSDTALQEQCLKYRGALEKVLRGRGERDPAVQVVVLVGEPPPEWDTPKRRLESEQALSARGIRVKLYTELLESAFQQYEEFFKRQKEVGNLVELVDQIATGKKPSLAVKAPHAKVERNLKANGRRKASHP